MEDGGLITMKKNYESRGMNNRYYKWRDKNVHMYEKEDKWIISGIIRALNIEDIQLDGVKLRVGVFIRAPR